MPDMKNIIFLALVLGMVFPSESSWARECVRLQNMAVKILKQENNQVHFSWKTQIQNACEKPVSATVQLQMVDAKGANLDTGTKNSVSLFPNETREIQHEKSLPSNLFYRIETYHFQTTETPDS